jgi:hypothetical protein
VREDERRQFPTAAFLRFSMEPGREVKLPDYGLRSEPISHRSARYGYVWRTTEHLNDRENGVLGGDVLVMNFQTNELLAVRAALVFTK